MYANPKNDPPLMKIIRGGVKKKTSPNLKISYRSEFLSNLNNRKCVGKLRSRRIQINMSFFSCVHFARRMTKIWGLTILKLFCAWWVYIKCNLFFWILWDLSFPTHSRWSKSFNPKGFFSLLFVQFKKSVFRNPRPNPE